MFPLQKARRLHGLCHGIIIAAIEKTRFGTGIDGSLTFSAPT